jgi:serpin B
VQTYLDTLAVNYGAGLNILDFAGNAESSRVTINTWVSDQTEQKIQGLLAPGIITSDTKLVLTNAIYFKANWYYPFNTSNTAPGTFTLLDGSTTTAQMMKTTTQAISGFEVAGEYQAVSLLYYGSKYSMVIVLPEQGKFKTFESSLTADTISSIFKSFATRTVTLYLPKFSFEWFSSLKTLLRNLGMNIPFSDVADFTGISNPSLIIGDAVHKAYIGVNEQGTEAAAATAVIMLPPSIPTPMTMNINRPFIFIIRENSSGTVLFLGRVLKP